MIKKLKFATIASAVLALLSVSAFAGLDMFTGKTYTTILKPTILTPGQTTTNYATTGVDCAGLQGVAALVVGYTAVNLSSDTIAITIKTCATTNGTYVTATNGNGAAMSFSFTNAAAYTVTNIVPNAQSRYWRAIVTSGATTTNAEAGVLLVTE